MYQIFADGVCVYDDRYAIDATKVIDPELSIGDNSAGSLTVRLPPYNAGYATIQRMITGIEVHRNGKIIWDGRVLSDSEDFWKNRVLTCEGALAFFNDTVQRIWESGPTTTVQNYIEHLVQVHNQAVQNDTVGPDRQFKVGVVKFNGITEQYTNFGKTLEYLNALAEEYEGHFLVRYDDDGTRILDFLSGYNPVVQTVEFGKNLLDFTKNWDMSEFATVLVPLGAQLDTDDYSEKYLTVDEENPYVVSETAVRKYGRIEKIVHFDEVTDPKELKSKAEKYLSGLQFSNMVIELNAVDLNYLDRSTAALWVLDQIHVISPPHGLKDDFPITKLKIPLDKPENATYTLNGEVKTSMTDVNNAVNARLLKQIEVSTSDAVKHVSDLINSLTEGYVTIVNETTDEGKHTAAIYISSGPDWETSSSFWVWNSGGLAYWDKEKDGYDKEGNRKIRTAAITMDGSILATYITAGVLQSSNKNVIFDLDNGTLTMNKGSIKISKEVVDEYGNKKTVPKFVLTEDGNVQLLGDITFGGEDSSITWAQSLVKILYATKPVGSRGKPEEDYDKYTDSASGYWHKTKGTSDEYMSYSYGKGVAGSWSEPVVIHVDVPDAYSPPGYIQSTHIDSAKILSPDIYGGNFYATGKGSNDEPAYYIYNGFEEINNITGDVKLGALLGYLSYDDDGAGTDAEAQQRVRLASLNNVVLKLISGGNMSLEAGTGKEIHMDSPLRLNRKIRLAGVSYGTSRPSSGEPGELFFEISDS